jgi:hypothetical protein
MQTEALVCVAAALALAACGEQAPAGPTPAASAAAGPASVAPSNAADAGAPSAAPAGKADRLAPPDVPPLLRDGVIYAQADDGRKVGEAQANGVLLASDAVSGKLLWALAIYPTAVDPKQETDVQWVFFRSMAFGADGRLRIVNEAVNAFIVDVKRRTVSPAP